MRSIRSLFSSSVIRTQDAKILIKWARSSRGIIAPSTHDRIIDRIDRLLSRYQRAKKAEYSLKTVQVVLSHIIYYFIRDML